MKPIFEHLLRILLGCPAWEQASVWTFRVRYETVDEVLAWKMCRRLRRKVKRGWRLTMTPLKEETSSDVIGVLTELDGTLPIYREVWRIQELNDGRKKLLIETIQA